VNATTPRPASGAPGALPGAKRRTWLLTPGNRPDRFDKAATLLFRFSALTYNAHRIHYDRDYARDVEGYPGLLVHGPLQAILMAECVRALAPARGFRRERFAYRFVAPHFDGGDITAWAAPEGGLLKTQVHDAAGAVSAVGQHEFLD
jgi:3-methylfumaryl-CoA hydratase